MQEVEQTQIISIVLVLSQFVEESTTIPDRPKPSAAVRTIFKLCVGLCLGKQKVASGMKAGTMYYFSKVLCTDVKFRSTFPIFTHKKVTSFSLGVSAFMNLQQQQHGFSPASKWSLHLGCKRRDNDPARVISRAGQAATALEVILDKISSERRERQKKGKEASPTSNSSG